MNAVFTVKLPPPTFNVALALATPAAVLIAMFSVFTVNVPASKLTVPVTPPVLAPLLLAINSVPAVTVATWPRRSSVPMDPPPVPTPLMLATVMFAAPVPALLVTVTVPGLPAAWEANLTSPGPVFLPRPILIVSACRTFVPVPSVSVPVPRPLLPPVSPTVRVVATIVFATLESSTVPGPWVVPPTPMLKFVTLALNPLLPLPKPVRSRVGWLQ